MYKILKKEYLNSSVVRMVIDAPAVARRADAGQFIILRATADGERIPLTVADFDRERGKLNVKNNVGYRRSGKRKDEMGSVVFFSV